MLSNHLSRSVANDQNFIPNYLFSVLISNILQLKVLPITVISALSISSDIADSESSGVVSEF